MSILGRKILMAMLVAAFGVQTWMVYTDPAGRKTPPLTGEAAEGWRLWHHHNCQSCHQLYGFGGFLGPDLTNAAPNLTEARLEAALTIGTGQMPSFHLEADQRSALFSFLSAVNATGVGQLRLEEAVAARDLLAQTVEKVTSAGSPLTAAEAAGFAVVQAQNCLDCHLPNPASLKKSTDLTTLIAKLGRDGVLAIVMAGIPTKGMPRIELSPQQQDGLPAFLTWMSEHQGEVQSAFSQARIGAGNSFSDIPWFEYSDS